MKALEAEVVTQLNATGKRPALLFEIGLSSTLRFCAYKTNITFPTAGNVYTAKYITVEGVSQSLEGQIERITVKFDNVNRDMAAYANIEEFRGKTLIIKRVYLDAMASALNYVEVFNGSMEQPKPIDRQWLTVTATVGKPLSRKALKVNYQRQCPWIFGGAECNIDGNADLTTLKAVGTADSGTTITLVDNALTQADDYWNYGEITIVKGGITYYRKVKSFDAATDTITLDVELPVAIDNTCTYTVYKGCDQTLDACLSNNAWGPSADNNLNFGGCIHITKLADAG
jgi:hypothetical protein